MKASSQGITYRVRLALGSRRGADKEEHAWLEKAAGTMRGALVSRLKCHLAAGPSLSVTATVGVALLAGSASRGLVAPLPTGLSRQLWHRGAASEPGHTGGWGRRLAAEGGRTGREEWSAWEQVA